MKLTPLSNRVLIEETEEKEEKTESGIILPDTAEKEGPAEGKVVAVGEGQLNVNGERNPMSVKVGEKILFKKGYGIDEIKLDGKEYMIMKEDDIIGIIEE